MKIIHTADLHLESKMESNLSKEQATQRRAELLDSFERLVFYASSNEVDAILISGDMFDRSSVRKAAIRRIIDLVIEYSHIKFFYLRGNHDCVAFEAELEASGIPENLLFFSSGEWTSYELDEEVVISGREITDDNHSSFYSDLVLDSGKFNIVMLHGQESQYDGPDKTHIINLRSLQGKYIDYLALGHIHSYKNDRLDTRGLYCYPGCPEPRGFDECGDKGFVVIEIQDKKASLNFVSLQRRRFHEIHIEIDPSMSMPEVSDRVRDALAGISGDDLIKLIINGKTDMDMYIDCDRLKERFSERFYFIKVYDRTSVRIDYESFANDRTLKGGFVRLVQKLDIPDSDKSDIIETGIKAIMGEDIS